MKFSSETVNILKNFSTINPSIVFRQGTKQTTMSTGKTVVAMADLTEDMPHKFAIYDLSKFLTVLSMFKDPSVSVDTRHAIIKSDDSKIQYNFTDPSLMIEAPENGLKPLEVLAEFTISNERVQSLLKAAAVLSSQDVMFYAEDGKLFVKAFNQGDSSSDKYEIELGEADSDFNVLVKIENLKLLPAEYNVKVTSKYVQFSASNPNVTYWVVIQQVK